MKKLISIICIAAMLATLILPIGATPRNGENTRPVRITDALDIVREVVGISNNALASSHDFNRNQRIDIGDALLAVRSVVGIGEQQVVVMSEPDPDPKPNPDPDRDPRLNQNFCDSSVLVVLHAHLGRLNQEQLAEFFDLGFPIERIVDLTKGDVDIAETNVSAPFRQILAIDLPINCRQNVLDVIDILKPIIGIMSAEPNFIGHWCCECLPWYPWNEYDCDDCCVFNPSKWCARPLSFQDLMQSTIENYENDWVSKGHRSHIWLRELHDLAEWAIINYEKFDGDEKIVGDFASIQALIERIKNFDACDCPICCIYNPRFGRRRL